MNKYIFIQFIYVARDVYDGEWRDDKQHVLGVEVWPDNSKMKDNMKMKKAWLHISAKMNISLQF